MKPARKRCPGCKKRLATAAFGNNACTPDGLSTYCRECNNEKQRVWKLAHVDRVRQWAREYRERMKRRNGAIP